MIWCLVLDTPIIGWTFGTRNVVLLDTVRKVWYALVLGNRHGLSKEPPHNTNSKGMDCV